MLIYIIYNQRMRLVTISLKKKNTAMENNLHSHSVKLVSVVWDVGSSRSA